jgi:hypothetical protein
MPTFVAGLRHHGGVVGLDQLKRGVETDHGPLVV